MVVSEVPESNTMPMPAVACMDVLTIVCGALIV